MLVGGAVGGSGRNDSVMAVTVGACVGSDRRTAMGSGGGLAVFVDMTIAGVGGSVVFFVSFYSQPVSSHDVSVFVVEKRVSFRI